MSTERREVTATTAKGTPDLVEIFSAINTFPTATVRYHAPTSSSAIDAIAADTASAAQADQQLMFTPRLGVDGGVSVTDGKGNTLEFTGFTTAPSHTIGAGGVGSSATFMHGSALISSYAPSIYDVSVSSQAAGRLGVKSAQVTTRIQTILDETVKMWQTTEGRVRGTVENEKLKDKVHAQNTVIAKLVKKLFAGSLTKIEGLDLLGKHSSVNMGINYHLLKTIMSPRTDFWIALQAIMAQWQLYYAPSKQNGAVGAILTLNNVLEGGTAKTVIVNELTIAAGPNSIMPVTQVLVEGTMSYAPRVLKQDRKMGQVVDRVVAFPKEFVGGRLVRTGLPPFLGMPFPGLAPPAGPSLKIDDYDKSQAKGATDLEEFNKLVVDKFIPNWAKNFYVDMVLSPCTAQMVCELDLSWEAGTVYNVSADAVDGSTVLFTGLLNSESHSIQSTQQGAAASSTLSFSHVRVKGVELPL